MLSESVAQKPTLAVSEATKNGQNCPAFGPPSANFDGCDEHLAEAAGRVVGPGEQHEAERDQERRLDVQAACESIRCPCR